jgi:hypothetical protein
MGRQSARRRWISLFLAGAVWSLGVSARAERARAGSLDAFVILDESGSMQPIFTRVTGYLAEALVRDYLAPSDYLLVLGFSDVPHVRISQGISSPCEKQNVESMLRDLNVRPMGYTDMGRALEELLSQIEGLAAPSHQQVVLILTDGLNQPPRESPYYDPMRPDSGAGLAPPSRFGPRFAAQVERLAAKGYRVHVVGIGAETDALALAQALGAGHTLLQRFDAAELRAALARFWDETINLVGVDVPQEPVRAGGTAQLRVRLKSASDRPAEVELRGVRVSRLLSKGQALDGSLVSIEASSARVGLAPRQALAFDARIRVSAVAPAGDYLATIFFDQASAVRFYPPEADIAFHVPSFLELYGRRLAVGSVAVALLIIVGVFYRRRPVSITMMVEGESASPAKPARLAIGAGCSLGGGATDRLRLPGLPQKVALLERRSVTRFALVSSQASLVPTVPEYALGAPVEIRVGPAPEDRRTVRFVRTQARPARRPQAPRPRATPRGSDAVDFR